MAIQFLNTVAVDTNVLYVDTANDRVGIGVTNPSSFFNQARNLVVGGSGNVGATIYSSSSGNTFLAFADVADGANSGFNAGGSIYYEHANDAMVTRVNGSERIRINSSGNVGIGTSSPTFKLDVAGSARSNFFALRLNQSLPSESSAIYRPATGTFAIVTAAAERMRIDSSGRVGIGTTTPSTATKLQVGDGTSDDAIRSYYSDGTYAEMHGYGLFFNRTNSYIRPTADNNATLNIGSFSQTWNTVITDASTTIFRVDGSEKMRINSSGKVGIGDTDPGARLVVAQPQITSGGFSTPFIELKSTAQTNNTGLVAMSFSTSTADNYGYSIGALRGSSGGASSFVISHHDNSLTGTERIRIDSSGNVGIGTTDPAELLTVSASDDVSIRVNSTKNGTWTTNQKLGAFEFFGNDSSSGGAGLKGYINLTSVNTFGAAFDMNFGVGDNATDRMVIKYNGNVGIGTTSPSQKLDVVGNIRSQFNSGDYSQLESNGSGGVIKAVSSTSTTVLFRSYGDSYILNDLGIGTSSPSARLHVESTTSTTSSNILRLKSLTASSGPFIRMIDFVRSNNSTRGYIAMNPFSVQYNSTSDYRLKRNVTPMENSIDRIKLLKPSRFNWVEGPDDYVVDGFIAHEVQDVVHDAVSGEKDAVDENNEPAYQGIDQSKLVPLLTAALQDAITKIEQLETRIQTLENN